MDKKQKELFQKIRHIEVQATKFAQAGLAGAYHSKFKGQGIEFEEVREYLPGDDVRVIDWKVTARMNHPYVKQFCEERELTLMLLVDVSASSNFGSKKMLKKEWIAEVGAVLAFSAIKNNDNVGLLLFSSEVEKYLPPNKGTRHVLHVIRELLAFEPKYSGTNLEKALHFFGHIQRKSGICFLISDFIDISCERALLLTAKKHDLISILVRDPKEKKLKPMGLTAFEDLETGESLIVDTESEELQRLYAEKDRVRRQEQHTLMERIGASLIEMTTDQPYLPSLQKFFEKRERI